MYMTRSVQTYITATVKIIRYKNGNTPLATSPKRAPETDWIT